jgi:hypothetical protein
MRAANPKRETSDMTKRERDRLRRLIGQHDFLWIESDYSGEPESTEGFGVHDRRLDIGRNLGTWIDSEESLAYLVRHGAEAWCESRFNGGEQIDPIALLAGALSVNAIAAVLADLEMSDQPSAKHQAVQDHIFRVLEEQLARLEGEDAAERLD